jgi:hypothetical protein
VEDQLDTVKRLVQQLLIGDAALNEVDIAADFFQVLTMAGR